MKYLNLLGKDYFSQAEAAHYCCMSLSQFLPNGPAKMGRFGPFYVSDY